MQNRWYKILFTFTQYLSCFCFSPFATYQLSLWFNQVTLLIILCSSLTASLHAQIVTLSAKYESCSSLVWSPFLAQMHVHVHTFFALIKVPDV